MSFTAAKEKAAQEINAEQADNGIHYQWILAKKTAVENMTEEQYQTVIRSGTGARSLEISEAAKVIQKYLK
jgi:hypothetical protein